MSGERAFAYKLTKPITWTIITEAWKNGIFVEECWCRGGQEIIRMSLTSNLLVKLGRS